MDPARRLHFGSTQERSILPATLTPNLGPGCHDNHQYGTIVYKLENTPMSRRGYGLSARTAARFPPLSKGLSPSPVQYQPDQTVSRSSISPGKTPFNCTAHRFRTESKEQYPGPGSYSVSMEHRTVSWPSCFGRPDWCRLPQPETKALRVQLQTDKDFRKQRSRLAYLSLYY
ncbi:unnamed protein product [Knipowitschia caucasica]